MADLRKYGIATHVYIPMVKRGVVDHAVSADWTPAAGDVKISKDGGAAANVTNLPVAIAMGNSTIWDFSLTLTEMTAAKIVVTIADSATKAVEDNGFVLETYGNASAQHAADLSDSVRLGLTALPNAAAEAAGGLFTRGTGAGQINQPANGLIDASLKAILGTVLTETAGQIAAAFKQFFNIASPTSTMNVITTVTNLTNAPTAGDFTATMKTSIGTAVAASAVASVTGNVGGNVNGNVVGSVASVTARVTANTDQLAGQTVTAGAGVTFPSSVASPTNITAGTITTATTVTNGVTLAAAAIDSASLATTGKTAIADAVLDRDMSVGTDSGTEIVRTPRQALRVLRNKVDIPNGKVKKEDDATDSWTFAVTTAAGNPVTVVDPT